MDAIKLLGLIEDLDQALNQLGEAQSGQDPLQLLSAIEAVDAALLALGADMPAPTEEDPKHVAENPLYTSILNGDVEVSVDLLKKVREEAVKDPEHPQLVPAVQKIIDLMQDNNIEE